jgi:pimeloyl-ACP methyl ester carboxylesterase
VAATIRSRTATVAGHPLDLLECGDAGAPAVILAHGFPEVAWSWRHQLPVLAEAGYHAIAPDQRGYGHSYAPRDVAGYGIEPLTADLLGLLDQTGHEQAVFVGHDWGALIVWDLAHLYPERVRALVAVSVPCPAWPGRPTDLMRARAGESFFYILYFQDVGPAERELEADVRRTMSLVLWGASGEGFASRGRRPAAGTGFLTDAPEPPPLPWPWLAEADLDHYVEAFEASGFFGPLSYYRNLDANYERLRELPASRLTMPSFFIAGEKDPVGRMRHGSIEWMGATLPGFRGGVGLPGVGHWTQQEDPAGFNAALLGFLASLH